MALTRISALVFILFYFSPFSYASSPIDEIRSLFLKGSPIKEENLSLVRSTRFWECDRYSPYDLQIERVYVDLQSHAGLLSLQFLGITDEGLQKTPKRTLIKESRWNVARYTDMYPWPESRSMHATSLVNKGLVIETSNNLMKRNNSIAPKSLADNEYHVNSYSVCRPFNE